MLGGISSSVHRLSVRTARGSTQVVLKRFSDPRWADEAPAMVAREAAALTAIEATPVPAPRLLGACTDGEETDGAPALLMTRAAGRVWLTPPELDAWLEQLAALLPVLHATTTERVGVGSQKRRDPTPLTVPRYASRPEVWTAARELISTEPPASPNVFVHGDYQHFNVLWSRGRLRALVDWSNAKIGPADVDVSHCRLNLAVLFSPEVAERFRRAYEAEAGRRVEPWWDIHQLLAYNEGWPTFIPVQVAGRAPVDVGGMTARVEELLREVLARA